MNLALLIFQSKDARIASISSANIRYLLNFISAAFYLGAENMRARFTEMGRTILSVNSALPFKIGYSL